MVVRTLTPLWRRMKELGYDAPRMLRHFAVDRPPVDVFGMSERLGLEVRLVPRPGWDAAVRSTDRHAVIWIDSGDAKTRQRFSLAHEIGHLMLHPLGQEFRDAVRPGYWDDPREQEANEFAAELLMPRYLMRPYANAAKGDVASLARAFDVSPAAMKRRLAAVWM